MNKNRSKERTNIFILLIFILFSCSFIFSPYITIYYFKNALNKKEYEKAGKFIDFPLVRSSLKKQITDYLFVSAKEEIDKNHLQFLGLMLLNPIVSSIVEVTLEATVNPYGLELLLNSGEFLTENNYRSNKSMENIPKIVVKDNNQKEKKTTVKAKTLPRIIFKN